MRAETAQGLSTSPIISLKSDFHAHVLFVLDFSLPNFKYATFILNIPIQFIV